MYAFVDESGNTGQNLFDEAQPNFTTLALLTRSDFDKLAGKKVLGLAARLGVAELHAAELGTDRIEEIAPELQTILKDAGARFAISRLEKRYLLASKIFDAIFDSGENLGTTWHIYNIRPLRLMLLFKFAATVPEQLARNFWAAMMAKSPQVADAGLVKFCEDMLEVLPSMADRGAADRLEQALVWARDNSEAIYLHSAGKLARHGHLPNTVGFGNLLDGIEKHSKRLGKQIRLIRHDEQSQFAAALKFWHETFANASPDAVEWLYGEKFVMQKGYGSKLEMSSSKDSPGIQVADTLLWLFNRLSARREIGPASWDLMRQVFRHGFQTDFSFEGVERAALEEYGHMFDSEPRPEQIEAARKMMAELESRRQLRMLDYAVSKKALPTGGTSG
ncbi:DUF3800 domain-containing protein [Altererythrobacter sp. N1]|nr:DUF3800 domain-containing protein [Altererythrobacter sp. N1]